MKYSHYFCKVCESGLVIDLITGSSKAVALLWFSVAWFVYVSFGNISTYVQLYVQIILSSV